MFAPSNNNAVMSSAPANKRGISAGLLGMTRYLGQSVGVAWGGSIFGHVLAGGMGSTMVMSGEGMPSPDTFAALAKNPAALHLFTQAFMHGLTTVVLAAVPLAAVGALLSFLRGTSPATSGD